MRYIIKDLKRDFPDDEACLQLLFDFRYGALKTCPKCGVIGTKFYRIKTRMSFKCATCRLHIYPLRGTIFEKSTTPLTDWFHALYLFSVSKNGVSALEIERQVAVSYKTAHRMAKMIRVIDHDIATGVYPDMREHGSDTDTWPDIYKRVEAANIIVLTGPIWLGDNSSQTKKVIERLYGCSSLLNASGQYAYYGKVGGSLITGNEDGIKHCTMNTLYSLQHLECTIPPQADAGWIGEVGPGPSYGDVLENGTKAGIDSDFTNRNVTFMTWNLMHLAKMIKDAGGIPAHGNQRSKWDAGARFDLENPEYR